MVFLRVFYMKYGVQPYVYYIKYGVQPYIYIPLPLFTLKTPNFSSNFFRIQPTKFNFETVIVNPFQCLTTY